VELLDFPPPAVVDTEHAWTSFSLPWMFVGILVLASRRSWCEYMSTTAFVLKGEPDVRLGCSFSHQRLFHRCPFKLGEAVCPNGEPVCPTACSDLPFPVLLLNDRMFK